MNTSDTIVDKLYKLGLGAGEAKVYLELLKGPATHLRLAHATNINRTKVYRLVADLEKRSLVTRRTDDRGTFLVAADPSTLEVEVVNLEQKAKERREAVDALVPELRHLGQQDSSSFVVLTYEGIEGFKQMLWHELKAKGECVIFGSGSLKDLVDDPRWGEKHRAETVAAGYHIREIINPGQKEQTFTFNQEFRNRFRIAIISPEVLPLTHQMVIYNNTVGIYNWRNKQKVGVEIISKTYTDTMRHVFETYWAVAKKDQWV